MKKIMITLVTAAALTLTGCSTNSEKPIVDETSSSTVESSVTSTASEVASKVESGTSTNVSKPVASTTSAVSSEKPITSTASNVEKPASSSTVSSANPVVSSVVSSTKPVEAPTTSVEAPATSTVEKPTVSSTTSSTKPVVEPTPAPSHNCNRDGHVWGESYTKSYTEDFELKESHNVYANGYDKTLARRYGCNTEPHFADIFGMVYASGSKNVKTTATRTVTDYYHKCSECGASENYDTDEDVTTSDNWVLVNPKGACPIIWWDVDNIPAEVWEWVENDRQAKEDFFNSL